MEPTPVFSPRASHGQRSLVGYSPLDRKESDTTEATYHTCTYICVFAICINIYVLYVGCINFTMLYAVVGVTPLSLCNACLCLSLESLF